MENQLILTDLRSEQKASEDLIVSKVLERRPHVTNTILMVRPVDFAFNEQTAADNEFQHVPMDRSSEEINRYALEEFDESVFRLREAGVNVIVLEGQDHNQKKKKHPDAVFPNNWFSTHPDGTVTLYPMCTPNRRDEVDRCHEVKQLLIKHGFQVEEMSMLGFPKQQQGQPIDRYLEGTGSMVIDHVNGIVYAAKSVRTDEDLLKEFMAANADTYHKLVAFDTCSSSGLPFYHTNVMMSVGERFAVICSECIVEEDRDLVVEELKKTKEVVIDITLEQAEKYFCGNIIQVKNVVGERVIAMSASCLKGFTSHQLEILEEHGKIVPLPVSDTIEFVGGGSARCMIAEIFLPQLVV